MGVVLQLVRRQNRETVEALEWMLERARMGKPVDLCAAVNDDGEEVLLRTGVYRSNPDKALASLVRMKAFLVGQREKLRN